MPREQRHLAAVRTDPAATPGQRLSGPESDVSSGDGSPLPLLRQDADRQVELETQPVADRKNRQGIRKVNKLSPLLCFLGGGGVEAVRVFFCSICAY